MSLKLLRTDGALTTVPLSSPPSPVPPGAPPTSRVAYAAAHVIPRVLGENVPGAPADIDWEATLAFRRHLWSWGLGVADAMDTAQRNMGLDWSACTELIRRSAREADEVSGDLVVGVNTDHVADEVISLDAVITAYLEQLEVAEDAGAGVVLMASRHLARVAESAADYERVYREVLARVARPVLLHWLGGAFDPALAAYFGSHEVATASDTVVRIIEDNAASVRGLKMSLLNAQDEVDLRRRLPAGVSLFTGDDFNYVTLIEGDEQGHSDALLGAFAAIAPLASAAIRALDAGDAGLYRRVLEPTQVLSRHLFCAPTPFYKTGIAFLSWLNGHQPSFSMVGGLHSGRSLAHLSELVRLASDAHALELPELAAARWHGMLSGNGVGA